MPRLFMSWIQKAKEEEFETIKLKSLRKSIYTTPQVGKTTLIADVRRKALAPGKRISKTGNVYYETRKNRSDKVGGKI